jgi:hypothetical protein
MWRVVPRAPAAMCAYYGTFDFVFWLLLRDSRRWNSCDLLLILGEEIVTWGERAHRGHTVPRSAWLAASPALGHCAVWRATVEGCSDRGEMWHKGEGAQGRGRPWLGSHSPDLVGRLGCAGSKMCWRREDGAVAACRRCLRGMESGASACC